MSSKIESAAEFVEEFARFRMLHPVPRKRGAKRVMKRPGIGGRPARLYPSAQELNQMYNVKGMSAPQIAADLGTSVTQVRRLFKRYGIRKIGYNGQ